ncbi:hypothetical protein ACJIZ3_012526 [Penstemon smallii]|uniref:PWI domain-containing protein n=1 Tax=Penstemon smallii TaxID=265156 RepID=A0ABD3UMC3_9LAMI
MDRISKKEHKKKSNKPPTRLQKRAPASLKLNTSNPNVKNDIASATHAIPLLSPLVLSPVGDVGPDKEKELASGETNGPLLNEPASGGWNHPAFGAMIEPTKLGGLFQSKCMLVEHGTSADQDTRFSNKQAKLLKSQKFAPELENLVDMTKVKLDVMKPWIAKRVTELIGFEDEVLINFIYGLLEGKAVNGKQIQISLTGFMERNTGKFMKELWLLLLSAQQNMSGVPQQFLDAKEEETKKKMAETDRIADEIRRKKEKEKLELDYEKNKMDGDAEMSRDKHTILELNVKHDPIQPTDDKKWNKRNGSRGRTRDSPSSDSARRSQSPRRKRSMSPSKFFNSRASSNDRRRSRSISGPSPLRNHSISPQRRRRSSPRRSVTPRRRHTIRSSSSPSPSLSPKRCRSPHSRRRSMSRIRNRSPSPVRHRVRSPWHHRSRSPLHRRSRSPMRRRPRTPMRRSPARYRSRSPMKRRSPSPVRHISPSPALRRSPSPALRRSPAPARRRSPASARRRSPAPARRRSPFPTQDRSPSPVRRRSPPLHRQSPSPARRRYRRSPSTPRQSISPVRRRSYMDDYRKSSTTHRWKSPSGQESSSPSPVRRSSLSPIQRGSPRKNARSPPKSSGQKVRSHEKYSPARRVSPNGGAELLPKNRNGSKSLDHRPIVSLRSPQRDMLDRNNLHGKERDSSPSIQKSPFLAVASKNKSYGGGQRSTSPHDSPYLRRENTIHPEIPSSLPKAAGPKARGRSGTSAGKISPVQPHRVDHKGHREQQELSTIHKSTGLSENGSESYVHRDRANDKNRAPTDDRKGIYLAEQETLPKLSRKSDQNNQNDSKDSPLKETDEQRTGVKEKRKPKKLDRQETDSDDYSSYDSYEERREAKRRRKEEKKLKKEERRRKREDRRRRKEGRHADKLKLKAVDSCSSSSELERDHSEGESVRRKESQTNDIPDRESEQKKLEIELREKAIESLRAKKGIVN